MTTQFTNLQAINDQELQAAAGGDFLGDITNTVVGFVPYLGTANTISGVAGGPTAGDLLEKAFA